jgi:hypothetical protein
MSGDRQSVIDKLVADLSPIEAPRRLPALAAFWFLGSWLWVVVATLLMGPMRPGSLQQLVHEPHFGLETLTGLVAGSMVAWIAFAETVPGRPRRPIVQAAMGLTTVWLASHIIGFAYPALEPSMLGKRPYCVFETLIYAIPPLLAGLWLARRRYVLRSSRTGALIGLAAGMMPALFMQLACMYEPSHIMTFHIVPGLAIAIPAALAGAWLLRTDASVY